MIKRETIAIVGLGKFGSSAAKNLNKYKKYQIIGIDKCPEALKRSEKYLDLAIEADASAHNVLEDSGAHRATAVIIATTDSVTISVVDKFHSFGVAQRIIAKASSDATASIIEKLGATRIVRPEVDAGQSVAKELTLPANIRNISTHSITEEYSLTTFELTKENKVLSGKKLAELDLKKYSASIALVMRGDKVIVPTGDTRLNTGDKITVLGVTSKLAKLFG